MRDAQDGRGDAYADLLVLLTAVSRRYVLSRLGRAPWVEDVVQETLLSVHVARHTYDRHRPFAPWFYAILKSRLIDAVRRERRTAGREIAGQGLPEPSSTESTVGDEIDVEAIRRALASLPERHRQVIHGLKYRDESVRDVAGRLGLSEAAVKVTAHRGYRMLKRLLGGR
jgi:RNA polymerase sigma-70 factor (ECF subfamily)